jgi:hypothetical protein
VQAILFKIVISFFSILINNDYYYMDQIQVDQKLWWNLIPCMAIDLVFVNHGQIVIFQSEL